MSISLDFDYFFLKLCKKKRIHLLHPCTGTALFFVHGGWSNVTCNYSDFRSTVVVLIKGDLGVRESFQTELAISVFTFLATEFNEDLDTVLPYYLCSHRICQSSHKDCHLLVFEIIKQ